MQLSGQKFILLVIINAHESSISHIMGKKKEKEKNEGGRREREREKKKEQSLSRKETLTLTALQRSGNSFMKSNCWEERGNALSDSTV